MPNRGHLPGISRPCLHPQLCTGHLNHNIMLHEGQSHRKGRDKLKTNTFDEKAERSALSQLGGETCVAGGGGGVTCKMGVWEEARTLHCCSLRGAGSPAAESEQVQRQKPGSRNLSAPACICTCQKKKNGLMFGNTMGVCFSRGLILLNAPFPLHTMDGRKETRVGA